MIERCWREITRLKRKFARASRSDSAQFTERFTNRRKAFTCASVQPSQGTTGTSRIFSAMATFSRRWPSITSPSDFARIGTAKPNSRMLARI
jgi:hypothetical protein